jgi:hypothetical protein
MLSGEVSEALRTYSVRMSRELKATRRAIVTLGTASLVAMSAWLMAVALDGRAGVDLPATQVRHAPPSPQVTLRPLPVEAAIWQAAPDVPPLSR